MRVPGPEVMNKVTNYITSAPGSKLSSATNKFPAGNLLVAIVILLPGVLGSSVS